MTVADRAKQFYESDLQASLEREHRNKFVAIEPISRSHFIADTFLDAALASRIAFPERQPFVLRIGQVAAFHIGAAL